MELFRNTALKEQEIVLKIDGPSGLALRKKKYGSNMFYAVEAFFDEDFKQRITLATFGVANGVVTEKYAIPNVSIDGKSWNALKFLKEYVNVNAKKKSTFKVNDGKVRHHDDDEEEEEEEKPKKKLKKSHSTVKDQSDDSS